MAPRASDMSKNPPSFSAPKRVFVTPDMAQSLLERNTHNRPVSQPVVNQYAYDMLAGLWRESPVPIIFEKDGGPLLDGQHRLLAVVEAGVGVWFWIVWDAPREVQADVDQGSIRPAAIQLSLTANMGDVSKLEVAIARIMMGNTLRPKKHARLSTQAIGQFLAQHRQAVAFSVAAHGASKGLTACVRAVVARAWYTQDRELLTSFCQCVATGVSPRGTDDAAAAVLSKWILSQHSLGSAAVRTSLYKKTERALQAYLSGVQLVKLCECNEELYPIPGEPGWDKVKAVA